MADASTDPSDLGDVEHLAALAGLPGMGPARLGALLNEWSPEEAWKAICGGRLADCPDVLAHVRGRHRDLCDAWRAAARAADVADVWRRHCDADIDVTMAGMAGFPHRLLDDPEPPAVVFRHGASELPDGPAVAIVGTRQCTRYGHDVARDLGRELAAAGVVVVSGLALGIDAAAHEGALDACAAPPFAVVATGLDIVYPRRNRALWQRVADIGSVLTEAPLGAGPEAWRFPARNRIIAGLSDLVVVVESHATGGSLYTVDEAVTRNLPVLAVPGPIRSPASAGTNRLLADGMQPLCDVDDVFMALGLVTPPKPGSPVRGVDTGGDPAQVAVLDAVGWEAASLDQVVTASGLDIDVASLAIERLVAVGRLDRRGAWLERMTDR
jgi:DNA processing protein